MSSERSAYVKSISSVRKQIHACAFVCEFALSVCHKRSPSQTHIISTAALLNVWLSRKFFETCEFVGTRPKVKLAFLSADVGAHKRACAILRVYRFYSVTSIGREKLFLTKLDNCSLFCAAVRRNRAHTPTETSHGYLETSHTETFGRYLRTLKISQKKKGEN